uniref:Uncharacterized protein n=1 Tax=Micrurus surinamensis TaxID=129470 RepID=A0A2D4PY66_MICSU
MMQVYRRDHSYSLVAQKRVQNSVGSQGALLELSYKPLSNKFKVLITAKNYRCLLVICFYSSSFTNTAELIGEVKVIAIPVSISLFNAQDYFSAMLLIAIFKS